MGGQLILRKENGQTMIMLTASVVEKVGMDGHLEILLMVSSALLWMQVVNVVDWTLAIVGMEKDLLGHTWKENLLQKLDRILQAL